jgi:glycosyltransferase involved in cell wall biosynthesis
MGAGNELIVRSMKISVIFSTYNSPDWMEKVLWGFENQAFKDFEVVIADDGSTIDTKERVTKFQRKSTLKIKHVWQEDKGFRKTRILNKAIAVSQYDYLVFTDGDCVPRSDFLQVHAKNAQKGYFLSGGYLKLPTMTSNIISKEDIDDGRAFDPDWLKEHGVEDTHKLMKLTAKGWKEKVYNSLTPTQATWNGHNASGWRKDIMATNGFDERMQYGGEDRELGERLLNRGLKSKQIRYSAICVHLDHERGYVTQEMIIKNKEIRNYTKRRKLTRTPYGIIKDPI